MMIGSGMTGKGMIYNGVTDSVIGSRMTSWHGVHDGKIIDYTVITNYFQRLGEIKKGH